MKFLITKLFFLSFCLTSNSQNLSVHYHVEREIIGLPDGVAHPPLSLTGYYYKKGNKIISYLRPEYLKEFPQGELRLESENHTVGLFSDTIQSICYADLDSMILRYRFASLPGENENINRHFDLDFREWSIQKATEIIHGMECRHAIQFNTSGDKVNAEIWYYPDISMPVGFANLLNVPGLIVKAKLHGTRETYYLKEFSTSTEPKDNLFWPKEFNERFTTKSDLRKKKNS
ncbi:MAG: hypothetical protein EOO43_16390 [Flavobacterium sp.]|nr:MAG: hypothetical protein EOO43_16390 [Flavobacterium sp.]